MMKTDATCMDDFDPNSLGMDQARHKILESIVVLTEIETIPLLNANGRVLAENVNADIDVPGFINSAMDGYAFKHGDIITDTRLTIAGTSLAGHPYTGSMGKNECIRITTGAEVPTQADTVVMQENTLRTNDSLQINQIPVAGSNVRAQGSNIKNGSVIVGKHTRIGAPELGLLASAGYASVSVLRKLKVACFSTGDELAAPGESLGRGMIHDSNRYMLLGLLDDPAIERLDIGIQRDSSKVLQDCFAALTDVDVIISSGGVSVGEADFIKEVLAEYGSLNFWKIAMKPGRPLTHAVTNAGAQFFGLPGNPVSGIVTYHHFVKPALDAMLGQVYRVPYTQQARLSDTLIKQPGRVEMQRGILAQDAQGDWQVASTGLQDSHVLTSMHRANCYIVLDMESTGAKPGELVTTLPFLNFG